MMVPMNVSRSCTLKLMHPSTSKNKIPAFRSSGLRRTVKYKSTVRAEIEDATPSDGEVVSTTPLLLTSADERYKAFNKVLVAGATGGVGRAVVNQLSDLGIPSIRALVRDGVKASTVLPGSERNVEIFEGNVYKFQDVARSMQGVDAVICCTGPTDRLNPFASFEVDFRGTENLVASALQAGVKKFVFVTSIGADDILFPLNLFFGVLFWKKQGELSLQKSGIDYTIIRPGGLKNDGLENAGVVVGNADSYGLPPRKTPKSVLRSKIAEMCICALVEPNAKNKVIEVVQESGESNRPFAELFASVN